LLDEIARLLGVPEGLVRSLLPDELEAILRQDSPLRDDHYRDRIDHLVYAIDGDNEAVFAGATKCTLVNGLLTQTEEARMMPGDKCQGTPISGGIARGRCKKIIRREDAIRINFRPGDILVSESTDMDLYKLIREAAGVITESGGVACHAAIVCRELNKPALVGVKNALSILENNDLIVLNADEGYLTTGRSIRRKFTLDDTAVAELDPSECGQKAMVLARLLRASVVVPRFFVVTWAKLHEHYLQLVADAHGPALQMLTAEVDSALEYLSGEMFVIRSSMAAEDTEETAAAGVWATDTGVVRADVVPNLIRYIEGLKGEQSKDLAGSIIVQEMILGDASGICFTVDPMDQSKKQAMFEVVPGGNEWLTDGQISPVRYFASRETKEVTLDEQSKQWGVLIDPSTLRRLVDTFLAVEAICGGPQDIEWTVKQGVISILQSRPITASGSQDGQVCRVITRRSSATGRDISSIYQAYRIPPNLRLHLLRVAAFGSTICNNWSGDPLDHQTLVTALLLHDIGNIVKADYDRFPGLFPEEMKNINFWKEVQRWVRQKYGDNDINASLAMAKEIGVNCSVLDLMARKLFRRNAETVVSDSWELKIAAYADQRVGPHGLLRLEERLEEAKRRYKGVKYASINHPEYEQLVGHAFEIEKQICSMTQIGLEEARDDIYSSAIEQLRSFELSVKLDGA
jgi:phosphohistidine swiveling domain-containing protein